jgi:hypothetical protein
MIYQPYDNGTMKSASVRSLSPGETRGQGGEAWDPRLEPYINWLERMGELTTEVVNVPAQTIMPVSH